MNIRQVSGRRIARETYRVDLHDGDLMIALAGNPNTGKSTVFNSLTGLKQHTGNWPGKTVTNAQGKYIHQDQRFILIDLPGTYSLFANSVDEEVARDFICSGEPRVTVVVTDATCLERNLNLVLQVMEITDHVVLCVNLLDEAKRKKIQVDLPALSKILGIPVIGTSARDGAGLDALKDAVYQVAMGEIETAPLRIRYGSAVEECLNLLEPIVQSIVDKKVNRRWVALRLLDGDWNDEASRAQLPFFRIRESKQLSDAMALSDQMLLEDHLDRDSLRDHIVTCIVAQAEEITQKVLRCEKQNYNDMDRRIDSVLTSRIWGIPVMVALLGLVFWITIKGANYPSQVLGIGLFWGQERLTQLFLSAGWPDWLHGLLVLGMYRTLAWVISVMLPPMAIFFPMFTLLEDLGYLPRIAFNLDNYFKKACAHGKQALTMCMGFGCNAAGVISCRIIDSPRERLISIITNNYVPCNGRFPTLIALATVFIAGELGSYQSVAASLIILAAIVIGIMITLIISKLLSKTILKGIPSSFALELPPYRKPQIGRIIVRSLYDRTLFVLARAIIVAAPAGMITWAFANIYVGDLSILQYGANLLGLFGHLLGLDGFILMAFILGFPANEIVIPILVMSYMSAGQMIELDSLQALRELFFANGWTWLTALCAMLFCLNHYPCGTTLLTIRKETQSIKWTLITFAITAATGIILCFVVAQSARLLGL
ncbi:MAG: Small GTP-binding protein [Desulfotomaculum sp. 46_296]|nr:MAG: Small GTP-binding protein [Desulfotomaculum sp. 46_296]